MFGKKKEKNRVRTFNDGVEVPNQVPELDLPSPYPEPQPEAQQLDLSQFDCAICLDFGFYADNMNVWHNCPRCNPTVVGQLSKEAEPTTKKVKK